MTNRRRWLFAILATGGFPFFFLLSAFANEQPQPPKSFDIAAIDAYLGQQVQAKEMVGLSVAILRQGKLVWAKGYGQRSLEPKQAVETETPFAIGSITKQFACAAILLLAEDGKLRIDDKVAKYYPDLTRAGDISLQDLMSHVSGYPDYYPLDFVDRRLAQPTEVDKVIRQYAGGKLDFEPGTRWSYSNTGYLILGRIVERVSGESFASFLEPRILKPLGMTHTFFEPKLSDSALAQGFTTFALGPVEKATPEASGWIHAAGGIYASASDLTKWDLGLMEGKVLKPESLTIMTQTRRLANGKTADYGCGLQVGRLAGETVWRHSGPVSGFLAFNATPPRTKSAVGLPNQRQHGEWRSPHNQLVNLVADPAEGPNVAAPEIHGPPAKEAAIAFMKQLQAGIVQRSQLGEDFNEYLTAERVQGAHDRLQRLGEPKDVEVEGTSERGGMEVSSIRIKFPSVTVKALLYRSPDGKIQEFLIQKG